MSVLGTTNAIENIKLVAKLVFETSNGADLISQLTIVQAVLEGGLFSNPPSQLALKYNNLFGIKGEGTGTIINGKMCYKVSLPTHEWYPSKGVVEVDQMFAVNTSIEDSIKQHTEVLNLPRYAKLKTCTTFIDIAQAVYNAGYATDPAYPKLLFRIYNQLLQLKVINA